MHLLKYINSVSVWWHAIGTTAVIIAVLAAAPTHQSAKFVFATFIDNTGVNGVGWGERASDAYVAIIGILVAQYPLSGKPMPCLSVLKDELCSTRVLAGFDGSAHVSVMPKATR